MTTTAFKQGGDAWHKARLGRYTGSRVGALMGKNSWKSRAETIQEIFLERSTGERVRLEPTPPMQYGLDHEREAIDEYCWRYFAEVEETGIHVHPDNPLYAASPDGLIGETGGLEVKCPYKYRNGAPAVWPTAREQESYYAQIQWCMYVTGRQTWDFFQWAPTGVPHYEVVPRDEAFIAEILAAVESAEAEVQARLAGEADIGGTPVDRWRAATAKAEEIKAQIKELQTELKQHEGDADAAVQDQLAASGEVEADLGEGLRLARTEKNGSVSWKSVAEALEEKRAGLVELCAILAGHAPGGLVESEALSGDLGTFAEENRGATKVIWSITDK